MAKKLNKTKPTRRPAIKSKAKRRESKPLSAVSASVRTAKPSTSMSTTPNGKPPTSTFSPALTGVQMMASMIGTYATLPARLWFEQARFVQRVFSESTATADRLSRARRTSVA
jgi:hypothetical protein